MNILYKLTKMQLIQYIHGFFIVYNYAGKLQYPCYVLMN